MVGKIKPLDDVLISKIAAGEVVERPASVVKELVENALDSGATHINISITEGGRLNITVADNGSGIAKEDLHLAVTRHATSKIQTEDDLFNIHSLGFRGEALASIDACAQVKVTSKTNDEDHAYAIQDGNITPAARENGTTVIVDKLFINVPARLKYLKNPPTEKKYISEIIQQYALLKYNIGFTYKADGQTILHVLPQQDMKSRAAQILGKEVQKFGVDVETGHHTTNYCKVSGVICLPEVHKSNRKQQYIFCNGRSIKSPMITSAIDHAFKGKIPLHNYPVCVLRLEVPAKDIDVNVHPAKTQVKFLDEATVYRAVYHAIDDTLKANQQMQEPIALQQTLANQPIEQAVQPQTKTYRFTPGQQTVIQEEAKEYNFDILGIVNKMFVIGVVKQGMFLVDFHAAYERLNYEKFKKAYANNAIAIQEVLQPIVVELPNIQYDRALQAASELRSVGLFIEDFGPNTIQVTKVPQLLGRRVDEALIREIIENISEGKTIMDKKIDEIITRMSCKASPRAGDVIQTTEARKLVEDLFAYELSWTCPHGRPVMILLTHDATAKLFKRHE